MRPVLLTATVLFGFASNVSATSAQEASGRAQGFGLSEIRAGVLAHSIDEWGPGGEPVNLSRIEDISFEVLFRSSDIDAFRWLGSPRINLGGTLNVAGLESMAHLGLTWQLPIFETMFFLEGTLGAGLHNGALSGVVRPARNLGCSLLLYEAAGLGMNVSDNFTVIAAIEHSSSARLCMPNEGLTNLGIKVGYRF